MIIVRHADQGPKRPAVRNCSTDEGRPSGPALGALEPGRTFASYGGTADVDDLVLASRRYSLHKGDPLIVLSRTCLILDVMRTGGDQAGS